MKISKKSTALLQCEQLSKLYQENGRETVVLKQVSFTIQPQELVAIVGRSGSGKSTLLHLLGGLDKPTTGEIWIKQQALSQLSNKQLATLRNQSLGFIYQFHHLMTDFNALENVMMPLLIGKMNPSEAQDRAKTLLDEVELSHRVLHYPSALSGGERQRVAIARALVNQPNLVLSDEPTGNLDQKTTQGIFELIQRLNQEQHIAFLLVTHDLQLAQQFHRRLEMRDGILQQI